MLLYSISFLFNHPSTTEIYTLSLHDALPIFARCTGKDVNSHTVLDGIITTIMATIQRINIIGSREGSRNRRRLKANQTRSEERFSRNAETDLVCRLLLEKKKKIDTKPYARPR